MMVCCRSNAEVGEIAAHSARHFLEAGFRVADGVHLVDADDDLVDAEQMQKVGVAARLLLRAVLGVDHEDGGVGLGGTGDHVLDELAVPRRVDQHIVARVSVEEDLRDIDGDALVALRLQRIQQERPFERHAALFAHRAHRLDPSLRQ